MIITGLDLVVNLNILIREDIMKERYEPKYILQRRREL
jgi:hypothetical protein